MSIDEILNEVSADRAWAHIEHITSEIPSRLAGSPNSRRMAEYAHQVFTDNGLESTLTSFPGLVSFPEAATVRLLGPEQRTIAANTLGHAASTDGIEGELIYVGSGAEEDYAGKDVRGKITLSELSYSPARHEKALIAWRKGSIAQIMMNWGDETNEAVPFGSIKSAWGNPTPESLQLEIPDLPCAGIARTEGLRLKALAEEGPVHVYLETSADNRWAELTMTSAEFNARDGNQFMLLGGHMDSWLGPQATDNAAGNACIMELAKVFSSHRDQLRRGLIAGLWMGHETGTMVSSTRFADTNWDRLRQSCVAYLQIDQPAMTGTSTWHLHTTDDLQSLAVQATQETTPDIPAHWSRMRRTGDTSFFGVGLPNISGIMSFTDEEIQRTALASLGWWHHSLENTLDKLDKDLLSIHLRLYATWMWELMTAQVLPCAYRPLANRFADRLDQLARLNVPDIDLANAVEASQALVAAVERLDATVREARVDGTDDDSAAALNQTMMRLARILIPESSTVSGPYGQDRYGHVWQAQMIPSLTGLSLLPELDPESEEYMTLWTSAIRARNRVTDSLAEATAAVWAGLSDLR